MRLVLLAGLEEEVGRSFCRLLRAFAPSEAVDLIATDASVEAILSAAREKGETVAILWRQSGDDTSFDATTFATQMRTLVSHVRLDLGLAETVPFILAVHGGNGRNHVAVEAALEGLAATTPYVGLVQADDLSDGGSGLPFPTEKQKILGERCFRMWKSMSAVSPERLAAQAIKYHDAPRVRTSILLDPGEFLVTSPFGRRPHPVTGEPETFHAGIDGALWNGRMLLETGICAWRDGIVSEAAETDGPAGTCVAIDHGNGLVSRYFHLERGSLRVAAGDAVREGAVLGWMGKTGRSTGEHLHFQLERNGEPIDPMPYLVASPKSNVESQKSKGACPEITNKRTNEQTNKRSAEVPSP